MHPDAREEESLHGYQRQIADEIDWLLSASTTCPNCGHEGLIPWTWTDKHGTITEYRCPRCKYSEGV